MSCVLAPDGTEERNTNCLIEAEKKEGILGSSKMRQPSRVSFLRHPNCWAHLKITTTYTSASLYCKVYEKTGPKSRVASRGHLHIQIHPGPTALGAVVVTASTSLDVRRIWPSTGWLPQWQASLLSQCLLHWSDPGKLLERIRDPPLASSLQDEATCYGLRPPSSTLHLPSHPLGPGCVHL